jgi:hypothetical protein
MNKHSSHPLYPVWKTMIARCENPGHNRYHRYGGRGIEVCEEWHDFTEFSKWSVKSGYKKGYQIDRINSDGNYDPDNCRWTTSKVNNNNRSNNRIVVYKGVSKTLSDWSSDPRSQVTYKVLWERLQDGWEFERALTTPMRRKGGYRVVEAFGEEKSLTEWVDDPRCQVTSVKTLWKRINDGWSPESALTRPTRRR